MLVYAWSECDESGNCLMPTYGDAAGRKLDAIARALARCDGLSRCWLS